jgi:TolA-binding protein
MKTLALWFSASALILAAVCLHQLLSLTGDKDRTQVEVEQQLSAVHQRLAVLEDAVGELRELAKGIGEAQASQNAGPSPVEMKASAGLLDRLAAVEGQMEDLKGKVLAGLDAVSPIAPLESPEEEIARADLFRESEKWATAVRAYAVVLERYPGHPGGRSTLEKAADCFDVATQRVGDFFSHAASLLVDLEAMAMTFPETERGNALSTLANACMHARDYRRATQLYADAIRAQPDGSTKVGMYWSMAFALRETQGEDPFLRTLMEGRDLALGLGLSAESFEQELSSPRPRDR